MDTYLRHTKDDNGICNYVIDVINISINSRIDMIKQILDTDNPEGSQSNDEDKDKSRQLRFELQKELARSRGNIFPSFFM